MTAVAVPTLRIGSRLVVTVPTNPSDAFLDALQTEVLGVMDRQMVSGVVLDISAVDMVDSFFARAIVEIGDMISLMGGRTVVTGLQPPVALTLTELGLGLGNVKTALDLEAALELMDATEDRND